MRIIIDRFDRGICGRYSLCSECTIIRDEVVPGGRIFGSTFSSLWSRTISHFTFV